MFNNSRLLLAFLPLFVFVASAITFSVHQNLWVDESTQMSGLSLSFIDVYYWLSGLIENPFLVPSDRMPVLSYWLGMIWGNLFGFEVIVMRRLSIALVLLALVVVAIYFYRQKQFLVLFAVLIFLCLSPNLIVNSVEIRAYALFFMLSTLAIILYVHILQEFERGRKSFVQWLALAVILGLVINAHFFGLVLAGSIALTYIFALCFSRHISFSARDIFSMASILVVASVFIVLPVVASFSSQGGAAESAQSLLSEGVSLKAIVEPPIKLLYRLVAHQTMSVISVFPWVTLLLVYGVIVYGFFQRCSLVKWSLLSILALGFSVVFVANVFLSSVEAMAPHYNIWMLPVLGLLFAYSVADIPRIYGLCALAILAVLLSVGVFGLTYHGDKYAHNRFEQIEARVDQYGEGVSIVYKQSLAKTWFAGLYRFEKSTLQFVRTDEGFKDLRTDLVWTTEQLLDRSRVVIAVSGQDIYSRELVRLPIQAMLSDDASVYGLVEVGSGWELVDSGAFYAQESTEIAVYKKTP